MNNPFAEECKGKRTNTRGKGWAEAQAKYSDHLGPYTQRHSETIQLTDVWEPPAYQAVCWVFVDYGAALTELTAYI